MQQLLRTRWLLLIAGTFGLLDQRVFADAPTLSHVFPAGGQRGTKVAATLSGKFTWPVSLHAPGVEITPGMESGKIEITIPADLPSDRIWIRAWNAEGISKAVPFLISNVGEVSEKEPNNAPKTSQAIESLPMTINGSLEGADVDSFLISLEAGQTLVASVEAHGRLGSPIDMLMQLCHPDGTVITENHDDVGLDPRIVFVIKKSGKYLVRVFGYSSEPNTSIAFQGGANCLYRLTLTTGPHVSHVLPLAVTANDLSEMEVRGWNLPAGTRLPIVPLDGKHPAGWSELEPIGETRVIETARWGLIHSPQYSGSARVRIVPWKTMLHSVPAGGQEPFAIPIPSSVTGVLSQSRQIDAYRITLKKGDAIVVSAESRTLDFPIDPVVRLIAPNGTQVAEVDDTGAQRDALLAHKAAFDGDYTIRVSDRHQLGFERGCYLLTVRMETSSFELNTTADSLVVHPDKPSEFVVNVVRRIGAEGAVGPITIEALDLPAGVTAAAVVSEPTGPTAAKVTLSFQSEGMPHSGPIRIRGTATMPRDLQTIARTPARLDCNYEAHWLTVIEKKPAN